jgi:hypothetical protein
MEGKTGGHNRGYLVEVPKIHSNLGRHDPGATQVSKQICLAAQLRWPAARGNFQVGQTAKARLGLPCGVTPKRDVAANDLANHGTMVVVDTRLFHP